MQSIYKEKEMPAGTRCILAVKWDKNNKDSWYKNNKKIDQYTVLKEIQEGNNKFYLIKNHKGTFKVDLAAVILDINKEPKLIEKPESEWDIIIQPKVKKKHKDPFFKACEKVAEKYKDVQTSEAKAKLEEIKRFANADENGYIEEPPLHIRQSGQSVKNTENINFEEASVLLKLAGLDDKTPINLVQTKIKKIGKLMKILNKEWKELRETVPQLIDLIVKGRRSR